jgi:hypothetical protein
MWSHFHKERIERKDCSSSIELRGKTKYMEVISLNYYNRIDSEYLTTGIKFFNEKLPLER